MGLFVQDTTKYPPMPQAEPLCKHCIEIKLANDNIYDVSVDGAWTFSRSSYKNVLAELEKILTIFEGDMDRNG